MSILTLDDVPADVRDGADAEILRVIVDGLNATASRIAPCLEEPTDGQRSEARLILIGTIKRWTEAGSGGVSQQTAGPFGLTVDTRQRGGWKLWPSDIAQLQDLCTTRSETRAFVVDRFGRHNPHVGRCPARAAPADRCTCAAVWVV